MQHKHDVFPQLHGVLVVGDHQKSNQRCNDSKSRADCHGTYPEANNTSAKLNPNNHWCGIRISFVELVHYSATSEMLN